MLLDLDRTCPEYCFNLLMSQSASLLHCIRVYLVFQALPWSSNCWWQVERCYFCMNGNNNWIIDIRRTVYTLCKGIDTPLIKLITSKCIAQHNTRRGRETRSIAEGRFYLQSSTVSSSSRLPPLVATIEQYVTFNSKKRERERRMDWEEEEDI